MPKTLHFIILTTLLVGCSKAPAYTFETVERRDIGQTVSVTGTVEADPRIDLQFQKNGKIKKIYVKKGQTVDKDEVLAELDNEDLAIQLKAAKANVSSAQAKLDQELAGATNQAIRLAKIAVDQAKSDLDNNNQALIDSKKVDAGKLKTAELAVTQAKLNLDKTESDFDFTKKVGAQNVAAAELKVTQTKQALSNSQTNSSLTETGSLQSLDNAYADIVPKMNDSLLTVNQNLIEINNVLGIDSASIVPTSINLGAKDPGSIDKAKLLYATAKNDYASALTKYNSWMIDKRRDLMPDSVDLILKSLASAKQALDATYLVLQNSVTGGETGTTSQLKSFTDLISTQTTSNNLNTKNLQDANQAIDDAKVAVGTETTTAKTTQDSSQSAYDQAVQNLETVKITTANDTKKAGLAFDMQKNTFDQAKEDLEQTKVTNEKQENDLAGQVNSKKIALKNAEAKLDELIAPPREVDLRSLKANVDKAVADKENADYNYNQTILKSPVDGLVADIKKDAGENITANEVFMLVNAKDLLIKANVSETDISKVTMGNSVTMTFDAFDFNDEFLGQVVEISPAETVIEGVIYYQIKINFQSQAGKAIRSGMTANVKIQTAKKANILSIPLRAVIYENNKRYVQIADEKNNLTKKEIETGLEGDQYVEVISGVTEGEKIVTFVKE